jgi:hypothetical protein
MSSQELNSDVAAPMTPLGTFGGRKFYLAEEGRFVRPGIYYWDGTTNVHIDDAIASNTRPQSEAGLKGARSGIYIASKTKHAHRWMLLRDNAGYPVNSTWIDEAGPGESADLSDLWVRCIGEASSAAACVVYREKDDVLKGAWSEMGAALAAGVPVLGVGIREFTIANHPGVRHFDEMSDAMGEALRLHKAGLASTAVVGETVKLVYTNYRGETSERTIVPKSVRFGSTERHPEPQWLLLAFDVDKQADREFALKDFGAALSHPSAGDFVLVPREEMTDAMMDAAQSYLDKRDLRGSFQLPGTFNWHEFWRAMLSAAPLLSSPSVGWREIESAPKDGTRIIGWSAERCSNCAPGTVGMSILFWSKIGWTSGTLPGKVLIGTQHQPTHWMPLPVPPISKGSAT